MKKILLLVLIISLAVFVLSNLRYLRNLSDLSNEQVAKPGPKTPILRVALVADSHNENELLRKALRQAGGMGINLVIGLGDYTNVGTLEELRQAKEIFDQSKLDYLLTAGDHDLWDSRDKGKDPLSNFKEVFGPSSQVFEREKVLFVIQDNSDIYKGISQEDWEIPRKVTEATKEPKEPKVKETSGSSGSSGPSVTSKLTFVFAQKTPFHPESQHVMGEDSEEVSRQARKLIDLLEEKKVDGFFSGDLHFFAEYQSPAKIVKMTTVGAVARERNFQGPRFAILAVFDDYSWEVEDIEIR